jgi:small subunit ribosomal protein S6
LKGFAPVSGQKKERYFMPLYEHVFLARQDVSAQQVEELTAQYKGIIEQMGGKLVKAEYWGVKSLAFRMRKNRKAHFTLFNIDAPHAAIAEIERHEGISEDVLRFITIRVDAHEEGPSAMMRKVDRDRERDERGGGGRGYGREGGFGGGREGGFGGRESRFGRDRDDRGDRGDRGRPRDDAGAAAPNAIATTEE